MENNFNIINQVLDACIKGGLINDLESAAKIAAAWTEIKTEFQNQLIKIGQAVEELSEYKKPIE